MLMLLMMMRVPVIIGKDLWHNVGQYANKRERDRRVIGKFGQLRARGN